MGNLQSCVYVQSGAKRGRRRRRRKTVKVIKWDGAVKMYDYEQPINVSQLMGEFPRHLVCHSDSFYIGQKIPALSQDHQLQLGHCYFLLPSQCFQSVLSFVTIASFLSLKQKTTAASPSRLKEAATPCRPFDIHKSPSGCLRIRVSDEYISQLIVEDAKLLKSGMVSRVCTTPQLEKDYTLLVSSCHWKPKLATIKELSDRRIIKKLSNSFPSRNKSQSKPTGGHSIKRSSSDQPLHLHKTAIKPCSSKPKIKIKIKSRKH